MLGSILSQVTLRMITWFDFLRNFSLFSIFNILCELVRVHFYLSVHGFDGLLELAILVSDLIKDLSDLS